ncbi:response regulator transcription factor [Pseudonocardia sp. C8]|uniref:response regulator n=1 Tax=Pseudonocardia sp. C8 TaxID=2762759 RepID=UPI001642B6C9|nr:response regulator transcription factor [Pseudonocardia sp. C8]MBC3194301.1 response regulator transcription factor [Pseudonocardia sp. C8]
MIRVLVVDDNRLIRETVGELLDAEPDVQVVGRCADGDEVLDAVRAAQPDVVLMDLSMPRMGGVEATELLRAHAPQVRVVVLTASVDRKQLAAARRAGAVAEVSKNADPVAVIDAVRTAGGPDVPDRTPA